MKQKNFITLVPPTDENPYGGQLYIGVKGYVVFSAFTSPEQASEVMNSDTRMREIENYENADARAAQYSDVAKQHADKANRRAEDANSYCINAKSIRDEIVKRIEDLMDQLKMQGLVNPLNVNEVPTGSHAIDGKGHPPIAHDNIVGEGPANS